MEINDDEFYGMLADLGAFIQFAEWQAKEGNIDGVCDPEIYVHSAREIIKKYVHEGGEDYYALKV